MIFLNTLISVFSMFFYSLVIIGYGAKFKRLFFPNNKDSIGEFGIFGFIFLYFFSILIHFFTPINVLVSLIIYITGIYFFSKEINYSKHKILINKNFSFLLIIFLLLGLTNQFHDDAYLYQLPYVNYAQNFKIIFGLVTINDYMAYGHGFYDILALFSLPKISNSLIFSLPLIFLAFFIIYLYENIKKFNFYTKIFSSIIIIILCFRYYQSKDYGTDLPILILIFLIQINLINYFFKRDINFLFKSILYFSIGILFKIYMIIAIFYLIPFLLLTKIKKINFFSYKKIIFFIITIFLLSFGKNIIHSGCLVYPIHQTCFESSNLSWSYGKDLSYKRLIFLKAGGKGWQAHYRFYPETELLSPKNYLEKYKYNYYKNLIKDQDFYHILLVILIFVILLNLNKSQTIKKNIILSSNEKKYLFFSSLLSIVFWFIISPVLRYGGYAFLVMFLFSISILLNLINNLNFEKIKIFIGIALSFLVIKNFNRIYEEISYEKYNMIPVFKNISYTSENIASSKINISLDNNFCGNIKMLCTLKSNLPSIKNIKINNGYLFITKNKNAAINSMNLEIERMKKNMKKE